MNDHWLTDPSLIIVQPNLVFLPLKLDEKCDQTMKLSPNYVCLRESLKFFNFILKEFKTFSFDCTDPVDSTASTPFFHALSIFFHPFFALI